MGKGLETLTVEDLYDLGHAIHLALYENENYHLKCYLQEFRDRVDKEIDNRK